MHLTITSSDATLASVATRSEILYNVFSKLVVASALLFIQAIQITKGLQLQTETKLVNEQIEKFSTKLTVDLPDRVTFQSLL